MSSQIPVSVRALGYRYTSNCAPNLLEDHKRLLRRGRVAREQHVNGFIRDFAHELRFPIIAAAARKEAVTGRLNLHIRNSSDPIFRGRAVRSQGPDDLLAFVERADVARGHAGAMPRVGLVPSQVHRWKKTDVQFRSQYEQALAFRTDLQLGEIIQIADYCSPGMVRKAKLQIDARKWILSRMMPKHGAGRQAGKAEDG